MVLQGYIMLESDKHKLIIVVVIIIIIINDCYHRIMEQFRLEWISEDILVLLPLLRQCRLELMDWDHAYLPFADL